MLENVALMRAGSVLVLKPSSLGDIVHTLPAVARLKAARPALQVAWLANTEWAPVLHENPDVNEIIEFPRRQFRRLSDMGKVHRWLRREICGRRPALALDFQGLLRSALIGRLAGACRLHGMADAREGARLFYHRTVPLPEHTDRPPHAVERYLALVDDLLGATAADRPVSERLHFRLPAGDPWVGSLPRDGFILLHPFSRGSGKSLSLRQIQTFCERLAPRPVVVVGQTADAAHPVVRAENVCDLVNQTTLAQLIWLIRRAAFVISVDSGPMHLAAVLSDRVVGIHGWSDPRRIGPYNPNAWVWKSGKLWRVGDLAAESSILASSTLLAESPARLETDLGAGDIAAICSLAAAQSEL